MEEATEQYVDSLQVVTATNSSREASDFGLVLSAVALPHRVVDRWNEALPLPPPDGDERFCIIVSAEDVDRAHALLDAEREDQLRRDRDRADLMRSSGNTGESAATAIMLSAFLVAVYYTAPGWNSAWGQLWANDSQQVARGEWWRMMTAVFVHGDIKHLANNVSFLLPAAFFAALRLGPSFVISGFVWTGLLGNMLSLLWHGPLHRSVGASGGVFGVIGLLLGAAFASAVFRSDPKRRRREVIGAGLALLGLTAFAEHADMMAHLAGCASGVMLGAGFAYLLQKGPSRWWQAASLVGSATVVVLAFLQAR